MIYINTWHIDSGMPDMNGPHKCDTQDDLDKVLKIVKKKLTYKSVLEVRIERRNE